MPNQQLTYNVVLTPDDGGWMVTVPDIPGCISYGDTLAEAASMAKEVIELFLEHMVEHGKTLPKPSTKGLAEKGAQVVAVTVDVPPILHDQSQSA